MAKKQVTRTNQPSKAVAEDGRKRRFFWCDNELYTNFGGQLSPHAIAVYTFLCFSIDHSTQTTDVGHARIAKFTGMKDRKVCYSLDELQILGLIEITHRPHRETDKTGKIQRDDETNVYRLLDLGDPIEYNSNGHAVTCHCKICKPYKPYGRNRKAGLL